MNFEPWEPSRLELLADEAGLDYWTLRDWLAAEVERRRANPGQNVTEPARDTMRGSGAESG